MSEIHNRTAELVAKYAALDNKPPMPSWVSSYDLATGQIYRNSRRGLGDPLAFPVCVTVWEGLLALADNERLRKALVDLVETARTYRMESALDEYDRECDLMESIDAARAALTPPAKEVPSGHAPEVDCPECGQPAITTEQEDGTTDGYCQECGNIWEYDTNDH